MARHDQRNAPPASWRCRPCRDGHHLQCVDALLALAARALHRDPGPPVCGCGNEAHEPT